METMRVELVEDKKKKGWLKSAAPTIITAFVALLGVGVSYLTFQSTREERAAQRVAAEVAQERQERADRSNRFTYAIEHLNSDSFAIRMGALYELKKLALEDEGLQEGIVRILRPYIRDGIENRELLPPKLYEDSPRPQEDVFLACEITSLIYEQSGYVLSLDSLRLENLDLSGICLKGADLSRSNLDGANLSSAQLQEADFFLCYFRGASFWRAQLKDATIYESSFEKASFNEANLEGVSFVRISLFEASLIGAEGLTAEQLLTADPDDTTELDPELRAEYERLKAAAE